MAGIDAEILYCSIQGKVSKKSNNTWSISNLTSKLLQFHFDDVVSRNDDQTKIS